MKKSSLKPKLTKLILIIALASSITILLFITLSENKLLVSNQKTAPYQKDGQTVELNTNELYIPSLNIRAPVIYISEENENIFQQALKKGVVHYPKTAKPGKQGNVYIFGHSSDVPWSNSEFKYIFKNLIKIRIGSEIIISDDNGQKYIYKVTKTDIINPEDTEILKQETGGRKLLTLQTSYPVGTALRRFIVIAELSQNK